MWLDRGVEGEGPCVAVTAGGGLQSPSQPWLSPSCFLTEPRCGGGRTSQASDSTWPTPNTFQPHVGGLSSVPHPGLSHPLVAIS